MSEKIGLTAKQKEILEFIAGCIKERRVPPSIKEIAREVGLTSSSSVHYQLQVLEKKGLIRRNPLKSRFIEVTYDLEEAREENTICKYPLISFSFSPDFSGPEESVVKEIPLPLEFVGYRDAFLVEMIGESMKEAGILHGDICIVKREYTPKVGDIVVAATEGEITIKKFSGGSGYFILEPENHRLRPIIVREAVFLGKVIGILRFIERRTQEM